MLIDASIPFPVPFSSSYPSPPSSWNRDQNPPHRQRMSVSTVEEGWVPRVRIAIVKIRVQYTLAFTCVCIRAHGTQGTRLEGRLNDPPLAEQTGG